MRKIAGGCSEILQTPRPPSCFALRASQDKPDCSIRSRMPFEASAKKGSERQQERYFVRYVHLLESLGGSHARYVGTTSDLRRRLAEHNAGKSAHTAKFKPWRVVTYVAFADEAKATGF
jgi:putative endonuclease